MEPAASELARHLRIGTAEEMASAHTRSHLRDGRVVGWYGAPGAVIDAESYHDPVPARLAERFGVENFWERWTATECAVKRADGSMLQWMGTRGLDPGDHRVVTLRDAPVAGVLVSILLPGM